MKFTTEQMEEKYRALFEEEDPYQSLQDVLDEAFQQASAGKGSERHGNGLPFDQQPMQVISDLLDSDAFMVGQAFKKAQEAMRMEPAAARREYLGAIVYLAGVIVRMDRQKGIPESGEHRHTA